ncbi:MAG: type II toxin-antitoxin system RelE/ParE family toxin [Verrucomicrobia bacterium]|nr:type II toxin-antitoxin system RelE/ParE family toxin [Verrucomicrobiota bacterium]
MTVEILSTAEDDLVAGYHFYEAQEPGIGDYFLNSIFSEIDSLQLYAGSHKILWGRYRLLSKTFPFGIFYTFDADLVRVRAVLDLRCHPSWIRKQAKRKA